MQNPLNQFDGERVDVKHLQKKTPVKKIRGNECDGEKEIEREKEKEKQVDQFLEVGGTWQFIAVANGWSSNADKGNMQGPTGFTGEEGSNDVEMVEVRQTEAI